MGQCMQMSVTNSRMHPYLGYLTELSEEKANFLRLSLPLLNEEEYISWSKNTNKLRYNLQIRDYLYLPTREKFHQSEGMCESGSRLQLFFPPYLQTLKQTLIKNLNLHRYFHQSYLWYLIYVLVRYIKYYEKKDQEVRNLNLDNLLVFADGALRIIPENIIPNQDQLSTLHAELDELQDNSTQHSSYFNSKVEENLTELYVAGAICLCAADLLHPAIFFDKTHQKWRAIGDQSRKEALRNCERRYSPLLLQTLSELTQRNKEKQIKIDPLYKRLELFENQILAKKELGVGLNMGYSSIQSIKTSYCMQNKTILTNNSNLFRLSQVQNESTTPSNLSAKKSYLEKIIYEQQDYLNIL